VEPTLVVVGLNYRTAAEELRQRFSLSGCRQAEVLGALSESEGIQELLVFSTCHRTEFVVWGDPTLAVNSILRFLTAKYDLKLREWDGFYRLLDEQALAHAFRVSCELDCARIGEEEIARHVSQAWQQARNTGCTGKSLDAILRKALAVRRRVRKETSLYAPARPDAAETDVVRQEAEAAAQRIVAEEVRGFKKQLLSEGSASALSALRLRLDEICRQELESFRLEQGPFPKDQDRLIAAVSARITHKIAGSLAREIKGHPESHGPRRATAGL
jgi:glutamyl-tRNA reductase